jgi:UDP-2,4-diacetamido-2,4,6-trideoxy-beta-L-altropyranose hydrolase
MNNTISMGHVMRCLSVADAAAEAGAECIFIAADDQPLSLIRERGYECIVLGTKWDDMEGEITELEKVIRDKEIGKLLIDSYQVTMDYLRRVNCLTDVFYLDDLNSFVYPVHAVINYAVYAEADFYPDRFPEAGYYLGCKFAPLRKAFTDPNPKVIVPEVRNILIMSGGSDPFGIIGDILDEMPLEKYNDINVICGNYNPRETELRDRYKDRPQVHIYPHVADIWRLYEQADIAVSAGGSTLYELSSMGVPTITYSMADNQIPNVTYFDRYGLMPCAGDVREGNVPAGVCRLLEDMDSPERRADISGRLQQLVDGKGAARLASLILEDN